MHRALHRQDVLESIFLDFSTEECTALAIMCKAFLDPCLNTVWYSLEEGSGPLLDLLGEVRKLAMIVSF